MRNRTTIAALMAGLTLGFAAHAAEQVSPPKTDTTVDSNVSGMKVAIDPATGKIREMTPTESRKLSTTDAAAARIQARDLHMPLNASEARKTMKRRSDGTVSVKAPVSSMSEMRATIGTDGKVSTYEAEPGSVAPAAQAQEATQ